MEKFALRDAEIGKQEAGAMNGRAIHAVVLRVHRLTTLWIDIMISSSEDRATAMWASWSSKRTIDSLQRLLR